MENVLDKLKEIAAAAMYAAEGIGIEAVLERIAEVSRDVARTRYAALGVPDSEGNMHYFKTSGMTEEEIAHMPHPPRGRGLLGAILHERQTISVEDMSKDPRSVGFPEEHPYMKSLLGTPIQLGGQLFGMLYLCDKEDGSQFNERDELLVEMLAGYAALAIAGAQITEQRQQLSIMQERERISMELHDGIIQSLYGVGMQVDLLRISSEDEELAQSLSSVVDNLNDTIEDIRGYIMKLRSLTNRSDSMYYSVKQILARLYIPAHMTVEMDVPDEKPPVSPVVFESICLMVNEALSNAIRHATAKKIEISMARDNNNFITRICDDGQGFELHVSGEHRGLGLHNMKQRAQLYGGDIFIESTPGAGTAVSIVVPVRLN